MYLVVFCDGYSNFFDGTTRLFSSKSKAEKYCERLNQILAILNHCNIEDLGDYYEVIFISKMLDI